MNVLGVFSRSRAERKAHVRAVARFLSQKAAIEAAAVPAPVPPRPVFPFADVVERIGGTPGIPIGLGPDGQVVSLALESALRHGLVNGGSGSGKTRSVVGLFALHLNAALGLPTPGVGHLPDFGARLEHADPKGETATLEQAYVGATYVNCDDDQRERLTKLVAAIDLDETRITPIPLFDRSRSCIHPAFLADLRVQAESEGADLRSTPLSRDVRSQLYAVMAHLELPLNYGFVMRFLTEPRFRATIMESVPDRDLRLYWATADRLIPRQTTQAVLRAVRSILKYPDIRLRVGVPPADVRRLLGGRPPSRFTIGNFTPKSLPFPEAMAQARLRIADACAETVFRDASIPGQLLLEEAGMLFHESQALSSVLSLASRTTRSAGLGVVVIGQDMSNTIPASTMSTLVTNAMWMQFFRSRPAESDWIFDELHEADTAVSGSSEAERRRSFRRYAHNLPTRRFFLYVVGAPAIELTALPVPDPEEGTGRSRSELVEIFKSRVAIHSMIKRADAEASIEAFETRVVGNLEVAPAPDPGTAVRSLRDVLADMDDEEDGDGPN